MSARCFAFCLLFVSSLHSARAQRLETAEMGKVKLSFLLDDSGTPVYSVLFDNKPVVLSSRMGFVLNEDSAFYRGFALGSVERRTVDESWRPVWGESREIRDHYTELTVHLVKGLVTAGGPATRLSDGQAFGNGSAGGVAAGPRRYLDIVFRVFADGVGFRYVFPKQTDLKYFVVTDERTQFRLAGDHKTFWIPGDYDSNEYPYTTSKLSEIEFMQ